MISKAPCASPTLMGWFVMGSFEFKCFAVEKWFFWVPMVLFSHSELAYPETNGVKSKEHSGICTNICRCRLSVHTPATAPG